MDGSAVMLLHDLDWSQVAQTHARPDGVQVLAPRPAERVRRAQLVDVAHERRIGGRDRLGVV